MAGTGVLVAGLAASAIAIGAAVVYLATKKPSSGAASACVDDPNGGPCGTSVTFAPGQEMRVTVSVPTTTTPASVQAFDSSNNPFGASHPWDIGATGYTYTVDFGAAPNSAASATLYFVVQNADGSTSTSNVVSLSVVPTSGGGPSACHSPSFACYTNGALSACCPSGDVCGPNCPSGYQADANSPGCCSPVSAPPVIYPASWNGPQSVTLTNQTCQPIQLGFGGPACCGTPKVTVNPTSFRLQVLDQNGNPMTGVRVLYVWKTGGYFTLDQTSYSTDGQGTIYPTATWSTTPTQCSGGVYSGPTDVAEFYVLGYTTGQVATVQVQFNAVDQHVVHGGPFGTCGSC